MKVFISVMLLQAPCGSSPRFEQGNRVRQSPELSPNLNNFVLLRKVWGNLWWHTYALIASPHHHLL